jgi:hypothetical protein
MTDSDTEVRAELARLDEEIADAIRNDQNETALALYAQRSSIMLHFIAS